MTASTALTADEARRLLPELTAGLLAGEHLMSTIVDVLGLPPPPRQPGDVHWTGRPYASADRWTSEALQQRDTWAEVEKFVYVVATKECQRVLAAVER